jgi:hypothetical protein
MRFELSETALDWDARLILWHNVQCAEGWASRPDDPGLSFCLNLESHAKIAE